MMATGPFAVPTFEALFESPHELLALVTRPDRPAPGKQRHTAPQNPAREVALRHGLDVFEPESVNSPQAHAWLQPRGADLFVVCDYGQILSRETLALARLGGINLHGSLLPKYRGAAPIQWAIFHGETETGVSVIHMTPRLDAGPIVVQKSLVIMPDETAGQLEPRLAGLGPAAVLEAINRLAAGQTAGIPQDPAQATKAPRLKKSDGLIDWRRSAADIRNQIRAMDPWPRAHSYWLRPDAPAIRLILESVAVQLESQSATPGTVVGTSNGLIVVACGSGSLAIQSLQPAGKRSQSTAEFLHGHPVHIGQMFGDGPSADA